MATNSKNVASRVRVALCGERNAGKTTLLNVLYRDAMVPDFFDAPTKPVISVAFGSRDESIEYTTVKGSVEQAENLDQIPTDGSVSAIAIRSRDDRIGACDVVEFPPLRDGHVTADEIEQISACDVLIWVTIGSQAWRLSEKTIIDKIPNVEPGRSVLAISRADKFRTAADQKRLVARVKRETVGYFDHHILMRAEAEGLAAAKADDAIWSKIGGEDLADCLKDICGKIAQSPEEPDAVTLPDQAPDADAPLVSEQSVEQEPEETSVPEPDSADEATPEPKDESPTVEDTADMSSTLVLEAPALPDDQDAADAQTQTTEGPVENGETGADLIEIKEIAEALDGFLCLVSFPANAPEKVSVLAGHETTGTELAAGLHASLGVLADTKVFHPPEWVHLSLANHQILYSTAENHADVFALFCRSGNPGLTRNAFLRMLRMKEVGALESA